MKKMIVFLAAVIVMGTMGLTGPEQVVSADLLKAGVVDMVQVGLKYEGYQSELKKLQSKKDDLQKIVDKEEKELMAMVKAIQDDQNLMDKEELKAKKEKVEGKDKKLVDFVNKTNKELRNKRNDLEESVKETINTIIREIAQRDGLSIVLEKNFIIFNIPEIEITDEVVEKVNASSEVPLLHKSRKDIFE